MSSDEEEGSNRQREFQTSFEEEPTTNSPHAALSLTTTPNTLAQITGKADDDSDKMDISSPFNPCEFKCTSQLVKVPLWVAIEMYNKIIHVKSYIHVRVKVFSN